MESRIEKLVRDRLRQSAQHLDLTSRRLVHPGQRIQATLKQLNSLSLRLRRVTGTRLTTAHSVLRPLTRRLMNCRPDKKIRFLSRSYATELNRLTSSTHKILRQKRLELTGLVKRLNTLNPLETLGRGFAIFYKEDGKSVIDSVNRVNKGDHGIVRVVDGEIRCLIEETHEKH